jgi:hypothetical protein
MKVALAPTIATVTLREKAHCSLLSFSQYHLSTILEDLHGKLMTGDDIHQTEYSFINPITSQLLSSKTSWLILYRTPLW